MASHILKASSIYMQMISAFLPDPSQRQSKTSWKLNHCSRFMKTHRVPSRTMLRSR
ncbi:hypothetical protein HYC85_030089 [Camellia sinensis]|uniref:Uncharacterized protein n=1 Tax=Camellia sinensis TaxID=4442 RepID=A0A7J7G2K9_CAMSI|nr:hypothetical protein HYC85_030089 [Camellia sinensis]